MWKGISQNTDLTSIQGFDMMPMKELEGADISLVEIHEGTPHCKVHGAHKIKRR
jgi:hypothetical protein